tara:strand:- start:184 stop:483 length:300 start_codon:yes stop_codon:yes gene_type:complete
MNIHETIEKEIAAINGELIVLNYQDGNVYNYTKDYLLEISLEYIEESSVIKTIAIKDSIKENRFDSFLVNQILQHKPKDSAFIFAGKFIENEIALTCNI